MDDTIRGQLMSEGYAVVEDFLWDAECNELKQIGLELTKELPGPEERPVFSTKEGEKKQLHNKNFMQSNDKICRFFEQAAVDNDGNLTVAPELSLNKVGHALHYLHPVFRCYTYCQRVKLLCTKIGIQEPAVLQSMLIYKNPGLGGEVAPHQDATYLYAEPVPVIGFWIALDDATVENGCLWIAPGSHRSGVHRRLLRNPDPEAEELLIYDRPAPVYPESSFKAIPVTKGSCILIHGHVVHKSLPNKSDKSRYAYTFHVLEKQNNSYSSSNWLQEGENAPFTNLYTTNQLI